MAFSQSLDIGNSTFMNLESQVLRAINGQISDEEKFKNNNGQCGKVSEAIEESPNEKGATSMLSKTRSRRQLGSNTNDSCRQFSKSKSDSKLPKAAPLVDPPTNNYSQFFRSDFTFTNTEDHKKEYSGLCVVLNEATIDLQNGAARENKSSVLDLPIFSEDVDLSDIEENSNSEWKDLLPLSAQPVVATLIKSPEDVSKEEKENVQFDETSFICPLRDSEEAKHVVEQLQLIRHNVKEETSHPASRSHINISPSYTCIKATNDKTTAVNIITKDLESLKTISAWNLPYSVLQEYEKKGVIKMFDWQIECLSNPKVLFEYSNLVYSAPTSAGKTLVSEILLLKTVLERDKKVLIILPFISVVREKMFYLQDLLTPAGYRVEGFFGGYTPPGGFDSIHVAICTIEKANSIVNKLLEQGKLDEIGTVVVDEVHLISDPGRGYILELLLAKILYMSQKYAIIIQVITMSATLANVELLKRWLNAELFITDFRPVVLNEMIKVGNNIYDSSMRLLRDVTKPLYCKQENFQQLQNDPDHVAQLCIETLVEGFSVIVFCPSKDWCENLAVQLAAAIHATGKSENSWATRLRAQINREAINDVKQQLREIPTGLDAVLEKAITFACAFHHAGLTTEERDIVESSFKSGALKIIVATSTLSSGVNLPARRVLIRSPLFAGKQMSSLTYRQMIGRAGRMGKDTMGESILICTENNARIGRDLITADLKPITSCLELDNSTHLKRALLEVISSGVASTKEEIKSFVNCTLLSAQKHLYTEERDTTNGDDKFINNALDFLIEYEFVRLQLNEETKEENYVATRLGMACLASSMPPTDGLILFAELQKSRRCFVLESELHAVYLVTPYSVCYQMHDLDWLLFLDLWEKLVPAMKRVGELVGVKESFLVRAMRGQTNLDYKLMQIHKRFYTALALQELVNETPVNLVAHKYKCTRGMLQSLQQMASTFAGIVTAFCNSLQWSTLSLIVSQFKERLYFGIHRDLIDLMRLPDLSHKRARTLFDSGITTLVELANANWFTVEKALYYSHSFDSAKQHDNENECEAEKRNTVRNFFITGKAGLTVAEAAKLFVQQARLFVQYEIGVDNIKWTQEPKSKESGQQQKQLHMPCDEDNINNLNKKRKSVDKVCINAKESTPPKVRKVEENLESMQKIMRTDEKPSTSREAQNWLKQNVPPSQECNENDLKKCKMNNDANSESGNMVNNTKSVIVRNEVNNSKVVCNVQELAYKLKKLQKNSRESNLECKIILKPKILQAKDISLQEKVSNKFKVMLNGGNGNKIESEVKSKTSETASINTATIFKTPKTTNKMYELHRFEENVQNNIKQNQSISSAVNENDTPNSHKNVTQNQDLVHVQPRRSPRFSSKHIDTVQPNAKEINTKSTLNKTVGNMEELLLDSESFELNTGMNEALAAADDINAEAKMTPFISSAASSAPLKEASASSVPLTKPFPSPIPLNKSNDEIASSQQLQIAKNSPHSSRFLRSIRTQRISSPKTQPPNRKEINELEISTVDPAICSSIDLSDLSVENSLIKNPIQLNASHILSCSKVENNSSSFQCIEIVDICGNAQLFKGVFKELMEAKRFGFCLGLQQQTGKRKPLIGSNLLINQQQLKESVTESVLFPIDNTSFVAGCAFSISENIVYYMNMQQEKGGCKGLNAEVKCKYLCMLLRTTGNRLVIFDAKEQLKMLSRAMPVDLNETCASLEDPKVANWLLQPDNAMSFKQMAQQFAPECTALVNLCGSGRGYNSYGLDASNAILARLRCSIEACVAVHVLKGQIENLRRIGTGQLHKFFIDLEMPLQLSLCNMEIAGFPTNGLALRKLFQKMVETMKKLESKIYDMHGSRFNLGSSTAIAKVLGLNRKANGRVGTSRQILEKIHSPISELIIMYRKLSTILTKNIQPLMKSVQGDRIHGQSITYTSTGRISMTEPNLQNVAKDFAVDLGGGEKITISCRSAFFPTDSKFCLIASDFCQMEMRILAHLSQDSSLLQVMNTEQDIFVAIAARWNKIAEHKVSDQLRNGTKQICYGIIYGMGIRSLAEALKCTEQEATLVLQQFHAAYPGIKCYTDKVTKLARNNGYIETITGRRRYLEHINSDEPLIKNQAERQAINSTIQGSAADIAKNAILRMEKNITKYREKLGIDVNSVRLVLHLHDELVFEVPEEKSKKIAKVLSVTMENCVKLNVPLKVKLTIGRSWGQLKEVKL